ncbi:MAG TPA: site-2 protease family protein [Bryobacteraceae bacterium]
MFERGLTGANDLPQNLREPNWEPVRSRARLAAGLGWWWINALLFALTFVTTTLFGAALVESFGAGRAFDLDLLWADYVRFFHGDMNLLPGLRFSAPLLLILLAHEFGHFVACRYWRVEASLPYFIPSPSLFGTWGAFIRIRSPIYSRKELFDIGVSGPIAGFIVLAPFLVAGVLLSRPLPEGAAPQSFVLGTPLLLRLLEWIRFGSLEPSRILLHPMAVAGWAGLLATAMNLLPIGQLDGGHILYAAGGERWHRIVSRASVLMLALLGFLYWPWWIWALLMFFLFRRHPLVYDERPLPAGRGALCAAAALLFVLSLSIVPIRAL